MTNVQHFVLYFGAILVYFHLVATILTKYHFITDLESKFSNFFARSNGYNLPAGFLFLGALKS